MTRTLFLLAALLVAGIAPAGAHIQLKATLTGSQETPPVETTASGTATFEMNDDGTLEYAVDITSSLTGAFLAAHIHEGAVGEPGGIVFGLSQTLSGTTTAFSPEQRQTLFSGGMYVNVHSTVAALGEIRGQIELVDVEGVTCPCDASFKKCVKKAIAKLEKDERKSEPVKLLKQAAKKAACGKTKVPKNTVACCLPITPGANISNDRLCTATKEAKCAKISIGGIAAEVRPGTCLDEGVCASPSGAFVDGPLD